tara:strand:- start:7503 stop:8135 length:633 start_codon:yes stop_codon:yes gene_type:complete
MTYIGNEQLKNRITQENIRAAKAAKDVDLGSLESILRTYSSDLSLEDIDEVVLDTSYIAKLPYDPKTGKYNFTTFITKTGKRIPITLVNKVAEEVQNPKINYDERGRKVPIIPKKLRNFIFGLCRTIHYVPTKDQINLIRKLSSKYCKKHKNRGKEIESTDIQAVAYSLKRVVCDKAKVVILSLDNHINATVESFSKKYPIYVPLSSYLL